MPSTIHTPTIAQAERECREFAREFPTPNTQRAIALCEAGQLGWHAVHRVFTDSLRDAMEQVR